MLHHGIAAETSQDDVQVRRGDAYFGGVAVVAMVVVVVLQWWWSN
jgi:hypothetical protein